MTRRTTLFLALFVVSGCDRHEPVINLACKYTNGSGGREATNLTVQVDLNTPSVDINNGTWTYRERKPDGIYGEDTISIRRNPDTRDIVMAAVRANVPVLMRLAKDGTLYYAYASQDGSFYWFTYNCQVEP